MASLATQALEQCPTTRIVLSGYSQGAEVVHSAIMGLKLSLSSISSVVLFGDPEDGVPLSILPTSKLKAFCGKSHGPSAVI